MRIIGIDPGLRRTGWGVIDVHGDTMCQVACGVCDTRASDILSERLKSIFLNLTDVLEKHRPGHAAVENTFVNKDATNTLKLGQARGICMLAPALRGLAVQEYAPNAVKKAVVGVGHATKDQVEYMVKLQLQDFKTVGSDSTDALAIAICYAGHMRNSFSIRGSFTSNRELT